MSTTERQESLFGEETVTRSLYAERAKVLDAALKLLRQDRRTFNMLLERQAAIETAGNVVATGENLDRAQLAERMLATITAVANRKGPISDALTEAARKYKQTGRLSEAAGDFLDAVEGASGSGDLAGPATGGPRSADEAGAQRATGASDAAVDEAPSFQRREGDRPDGDLEADGAALSKVAKRPLPPGWVTAATLPHHAPLARIAAGRLSVGDDFVGHVVGRKGLCSADVLQGQVRMAGNDLLRRHPAAQVAQDVLDSNAGAADHRLAEHYLGVAGDAIVLLRHGSKPLFRKLINYALSLHDRPQIASMLRPTTLTNRTGPQSAHVLVWDLGS